ncbi:hypothetical protein JOQ06_010660 [Pogonophryne albipinna]|uniref:Uncharacterized protein n=1 Tax=Pogonophryne albipinna TaxID=1090488 RepID=A0AAD6AVP3_9TELE|nr:hypothetical protein JOQ06_010660 [Pogonophryne albipinna]
MNKHILFCKKLTGRTTGQDVFNVIDNFFSQHKLDWKSCSHVCTDGAAAMTGRVNGLMAHIKKSRPLNHRLFQSLCEDGGSEHKQLLLHTDVRWLSRGKTLQRLFELRNEVRAFLSEHTHPLVAMFDDADWVARLGYLSDIFSKLNQLNLSLQGKDTNVLSLYDKVCGFMEKIKLWQSKCEKGDKSCFLQLNAYIATGECDRAPIVKIVHTHLSKLKNEFNSYFPDIDNKSSTLDWVRNPFVTCINSSIPARLQEDLIDVSSDRSLKMRKQGTMELLLFTPGFSSIAIPLSVFLRASLCPALCLLILKERG